MARLLFPRALFLIWGSLMLFFGVADLLAPRARYLNSSPEPGAALATPPTAVTISFSGELDPESTISVVSTVSLLPSGEKLYSGGKKISTASGLDPSDPRRMSLLAVLQPELTGGLYRVDWRAVAARGKAGRFGTFYFGVGMPVPAHITVDMGGPIRERNSEERGYRAALVGGVLLIALGVLLPWLPRRR